MLADETLAGESEGEDSPLIRLADPQSDAEGNRRAYSADVRFDRQRHLQDLFPARFLTIGLVVSAGLAFVGLDVLVHLWAPALAKVLGTEELAALSLSGSRNLSHWLASMLLGLNGVVALYTYSLRRHRVDDYHGRYRVWLWTALVCLLASLGETTDVAHLFRVLCERAAESSGIDGGLVWPITLGVLLTIVAVRLLLEMRRCRLAVMGLLASTAAFVVATCVTFDVISVSELQQPLVMRGSWLVGYVLSLATLLLYARHVTLEIEGRIAAAPRRPKRKKVKAAAKTSQTEEPSQKSRTRTTDLDDAPTPAHTSRLQIGSQRNKPAANDDEDVVEGGSKLSRADRRRMRRERMAG